MIDYGRLVAPPEQLGLLVEPAPAGIRAALAAPESPERERCRILNRPLSEWRAGLQRRLRLKRPVIVTGHQAEFFHAGVFAKAIAAHHLARSTGGSAVFFYVDSDLPKAAHLKVPEITSGGLRQVQVAVPGCDLHRPVECQAPAPREHWLDFFVRVASIYEHYDVALVRQFADAWLASEQPQTDFCEAVINGWTAVGEALGLGRVRELRLSSFCQLPEFRAFAAHLILNAPRLAHHYNAAQAGYRAAHRVRSAARPVPPLATAPNRTELPLWVFRPDGRRQRLYVAGQGDEIELQAGSELIDSGSRAGLADPARALEPWPMEQAGWRIRPRALALSAFFRLFVGDLFIHGIGGAKYDEVTDEYVRSFFEVRPPPIACVSATVYLPLPRTGVKTADVLAARHASRDVRFNPQRYVHDVSDELLHRRLDLIRQSGELRAQRPQDHVARRLVFEEIRRANGQILQRDPWRAAEIDQRVATLDHSWGLDRAALDREYFAALHPKSTLEELCARLRSRLDQP